MTNADEPSTTKARSGGRSLHRLAVLIVCLVWPLIWVGSLVTTHDAGMAVPDWPGTYGYNLFLYPIETWVSGPFDLFIEHGHRLLGALVGMVAIVAVVVAFRVEPRRWVVGLAVLGLVMVILQGVLGGMRVVLGDRTLAMLHGCTAPIVFSLFAGLSVATSRWWRAAGELGSKGDRDAGEGSGGLMKTEPTALAAGLDATVNTPLRPEASAYGSQPSRFSSGQGSGAAHVPPMSMVAEPGRAALWIAGGLSLASYLQLVLGAQLRHIPVTASPAAFNHIVTTHVVFAFLIWALSALLWRQLRGCGDLALSRPAGLLIGLFGVQIALGLATWVVNYGFPMFQRWPFAARYLVQAKGFGETLIVCGHVATGSLILATAVTIWIRCWRMRRVTAEDLGTDDVAEPKPNLDLKNSILSSNEAAAAV